MIDRVRAKHPDRRSVVGALLAEMLSPKEPSLRDHAANIFGYLRFRRGIRQLECLVDELVGHGDVSTLHMILYAIGRMDTPRSHAVLTRLLRESNDPVIRGDVLEMMAFEDRCFDLDLVLSFLSEGSHHRELISVLYALEFQDYVNEAPEESRKRIEPFLRHEHPNVRAFAVRTLSFHEMNRDLLESMADDPDPTVRSNVADGLRMLDD